MVASTVSRHRPFSGEVCVCCHRVKFHYDIWPYTLTERMRVQLEEEAEERAKACIIEGFWSGDLAVLYVFDRGTDAEIFGHWEIVGEAHAF